MSKQKPSTFFDAVYLINLESRVDKYRDCIQLLSELNITKTIKKFSAIVPESISHSQKTLNRAGCALSHFEIMREAQKKSESKILILEDDFYPLQAKQNFRNQWIEVLKNLPKDWQLFYLGGNILDCNSHRPMRFVNQRIFEVNGCFSTHAIAYNNKVMNYITSLSLEKDIFNWVEKNEAIDVFYAKEIQKKFKTYISSPILLGQRPGYSDIEKTETNYNSMFVERFNRFATRSLCHCIPILDKNTQPESMSQTLNSNGKNYQLIHLKHFRDFAEWPEIVISDLFLNDENTKKIKNLTGGKLFAWLMEPREINPTIYKYVERNHEDFEAIFTHESDLTKIIPNAVLTPVGDCWIESNDQAVHFKKNNVSFLSSDKEFTTGHRLRKIIYTELKEYFELSKFGGPYAPPIDYLRTFRFSVVAENNRCNGYFTEKIINCFRTGTIPIYWGDPHISRYFDPEGILSFTDIAELKSILSRCDENLYKSMFHSVIKNYNIANDFKTLSHNFLNAYLKFRDN